MPKGRQPIVLPALEKAYGKDWLQTVMDQYSKMTIDEAFTKFTTDSGATISKAALYGFCTKLEGFSFLASGKKRGKQPILPPALEKKYGENWKDEYKKNCDGLTIEEATEFMNEELGLSVCSATILNLGKQLGVEFKGSVKAVNENGEAKKRGKPSTNLPLLLVHFKTEENLVNALKGLAGNTIKDIADKINAVADTEISTPNIYNLLKKYNIELSRKHKTKLETAPKGEFDSELPEGKEIKATGNMVPVKLTCTTKGCNHSIGQMIDLDLGLALRARRCPDCNKFGSYKAQFKTVGAWTKTTILKNVDGMMMEVEETEASQPVEAEIAE